MNLRQSDRIEPAGFGMCDMCGNPLTDREMFHGELCESCIQEGIDDFFEEKSA